MEKNSKNIYNIMQISVAAAYVFLCFTILISTTAKAATDWSYVTNYCPNENTFSPNTTYETNLNTLLSNLSLNSIRQNGFYYTAVNLDTNNNTNNSNNNTAYGAFLCRGDLTPNACQDCVYIASQQILQNCPQKKVSIVWFAECMIRYSDQSFFNVVSETPVYSLESTVNVTEQEQSRFMQFVGDTMNIVAVEAANGDNKFATKEANLSPFQTIYTLAQCTQDLSQSGCQKCLNRAITELPRCCNGKLGARVLYPSCNIRYESVSFYENKVNVEANVTAPSPEKPTLNSPKPQEKSGISVVIIVAIVAPIVIFLLVTFAACWIISKKRRRKNYSSMREETDGVESLQFGFDTIVAATNNFCDENKLGEGGFGEVYKGTLFNGQDIAVKRLSRGSNQGIAEFKNEVFLVAKLQHRNLVRPLGFCLDGEEKMLIYELMPNKSLDYFLFDQEKVHKLNWPTRYKIIEGIARGMLYLHEDSRLRIIHHDLKPSNILLDENLNPKISDFGMARIFGSDETRGITTRVVGTLGYMPLEYVLHGEFSLKTDVYSFGVIILEIISGKKITSLCESDYARDLLSYAWKKWSDKLPLELLDMSLRDSYSRVEVLKCIHLGLSCVQEDPAQRPTMQTIVVMLSSHSITLEQPKRPAGYINSEIQESFTTKDFENSNKSTYKSVDEASITQVYPR